MKSVEKGENVTVGKVIKYIQLFIYVPILILNVISKVVSRFNLLNEIIFIIL